MLSLAQNVDFGARAFFSLTDLSFAMTNSGTTAAKSISQTVITAPFSFAGGTYPGIGGTCGASLGRGETCTLVLRFTAPAPPVDALETPLTIVYSDEVFTKTLTIPLVAQTDNGAFEQIGSTSLVRAIVPVSDDSAGFYMGGQFFNYAGSNINHIIRLNFDGSIDSQFNTGTGCDGPVNTLAAAPDGSGDLYMGGPFFAYDGTADIRQIARLHADGTLDTAFNTGTGSDAGFQGGGGVNKILPAADGSGDIYVGGTFNTYNTTFRNGIIRLNSDGSVDTGFNSGTGFSGGFVQDIASAGDGSGDIYVGGNFTGYNSATNINRLVRLNSDGSRDASFDIGSGASAGFDSVVSALLPATDGSGDLYVVGWFTTYKGSTNINRITRLNSDGSIDSDFQIGSGGTAGFEAQVNAIGFAPDNSGDLFVGGIFTSYKGVTIPARIARLNSDGSLDSAFLPQGGVGFDPVGVYAIANALDGSGDTYLGGWFSSYQGTAFNDLVRISPTGTAD